MKRALSIAGAVPILTTALLISACTSQKDKTSRQPVLVVNDQTLTVKDFAERLALELKSFDALSAKHAQNVNRAKENVLQKFINEALIEGWAEKNKIKIMDEAVDAEVKRIRAQYPDDVSFRGVFTTEGFSFNDWKQTLRKTLREQLAYKEIVKDAKPPTDSEMQDYFKNHKNRFQKSAYAHLRQIVVEKEDDSRRILERLQKGSSFDKLAREFSVGPEANKGGDLGWIEKGTLDVFDAAFSLSPGKRSEVLKSPYGYHIIELLGKRPASQLNFEQAKATILQDLRADKEHETYLAWLKQQLQQAHVLRNDSLIQDVRIHTEME